MGKSLFLILIMAFAFVALAQAVFASECSDACQAEYDKWVGANGIDTNTYNANAYYCGVSDTNCWSREGTPPGQPDPCWKMCSDPECSPWSECDDAYQSCCYASATMNSQKSMDSCLAACPKENQWGDSEGFAECVGSVAVTKCDGTEASDFSPGVMVTTGRESAAVLSWNSSSGVESDVVVCPLTQAYFASSDIRTVRGTINGGGDFVQCVLPSQTVVVAPKDGTAAGVMLSSEHGSVRGTCNGGGDFIMPKNEGSGVTINFDGAQAGVGSNGTTINLAGTQVNIVSLSSEHSSVRGTICGGGDFIMPKNDGDGAAINLAGTGNAISFSSEHGHHMFAAAPSSGWNNGRIGVISMAGAPSIVLAYALPSGIFEIAPNAGSVEYVVDLGTGSADLTVTSGSVVETEVSTGTEKEVLQGGNGRIGDWAAPGNGNAGNYAQPSQNTSANPSPNSGVNPAPQPGLCAAAAIIGLVFAFAFFAGKH